MSLARALASLKSTIEASGGVRPAAAVQAEIVESRTEASAADRARSFDLVCDGILEDFRAKRANVNRCKARMVDAVCVALQIEGSMRQNVIAGCERYRFPVVREVVRGMVESGATGQRASVGLLNKLREFNAKAQRREGAEG